MLIETPSGLFCEAGGFHIDPWGTVDRAVVTHAHGDHARPGNGSYLCAEACAPLLRRRFGPDATIETLRYGEIRRVGSIELSFHPAGHVLGSAQIRIEGPRGRVGGRRGLQARAGSDVRAVRAAPLRHVHHRIDVRSADLSLGPDRSRHRRHRGLVAAQRREWQDLGPVLLHDRQGAAAARRNWRASPIGRCSSTA